MNKKFKRYQKEILKKREEIMKAGGFEEWAKNSIFAELTREEFEMITRKFNY